MGWNVCLAGTCATGVRTSDVRETKTTINNQRPKTKPYDTSSTRVERVAASPNKTKPSDTIQFVQRGWQRMLFVCDLFAISEYRMYGIEKSQECVLEYHSKYSMKRQGTRRSDRSRRSIVRETKNNNKQSTA